MKQKLLLLFFILYMTVFSSTSSLYKSLELKDKMNYSVFKHAIKGASKIKGKTFQFLTVIDFTKPSTEPRFSVIDLKKKKLLYYTYVSHGKNSGKVLATKFSNAPNSFQSSLGFFITDTKPYFGNYGYSLRLKGLENRFNSNAYDRAIVIHGADYASKKYIDQMGFLGRTLGCPAIPTELSKEVIDLLSNNSIIFIAGDDTKYLKESTFIN
ncbi:MAG: murein L,D-transpeptidase catalytic domain family protein [Cetobacterium sp.]|uniref:murein L,D-transpeptidase catalytic domain family protein n=1 Tax=Cetobacterium TaxID=180162 RepID=UPI001F05FF37|nr:MULTISPECIES: murein L,D-transpeptidase catalytic domain family protein [Cetobacterium]MCX3066224.1 murein L,D-transpeptidase catalytic domain family protein [Cetobacterium somerae]UPO96700.1 murein L,D-transpeptidase catalytic domain family protein [Cetobacterium somerae]